jgi:hypothetical protein
MVDPRFDDLAARLARIEREKAAASTAASARPLLGTEVTAAESKQFHLREKAEQLARHASEGKDAKWAPAANKAFNDDLTKLGKSVGFTVGAVDCRTTICTADVQWAGYSDAARTYKHLLYYPYAVGCSRYVLLDDPSDPKASYSTQVVFDCEGERAAN